MRCLHLYIDLKYFKDAYRGSWKQQDFAIHSMNLSRPNLLIEIGFAQGDEFLQCKVQLSLDVSRGSVQVIIIVKVREGAVPLPVGRELEESNSGSFSSS